MKPETLWNNGIGYQGNKKFYSDIKKYGWDGFLHEILYDNLDYLQARTIESNLIKEYDLIKTGYNQATSSLTDFTLFDFYNFAMLKTKKHEYKNTVNYFTKIPNIFIKNDIQNLLGLHRVFLVVYILIDRNKSYENKSYISIGQVFRLCNYKTTRNKPKVFYEVIKSLLFLKENNFINTNFDYHTIGYEDCVEIEIINENYIPTKDYSILSGKTFDSIMSIDSKINKENILVAFLYILSYIGCRKRNDDGSELDNAKENPEAFFKSIKHMAKELSMSKDTISKCIEYLTQSSDNHDALLIKREVGSIQLDKTKPPKTMPNIYVLNKNGYEQEIKWALEKIIDIYKTDKIHPTTQ